MSLRATISPCTSRRPLVFLADPPRLDKLRKWLTDRTLHHSPRLTWSQSGLIVTTSTRLSPLFRFHALCLSAALRRRESQMRERTKSRNEEAWTKDWPSLRFGSRLTRRTLNAFRTFALSAFRDPPEQIARYLILLFTSCQPPCWKKVVTQRPRQKMAAAGGEGENCSLPTRNRQSARLFISRRLVFERSVTPRNPLRYPSGRQTPPALRTGRLWSRLSR